MPIKFRCPHCKQFLGISRSKAGTISDCPSCGRTLRVPHPDGRVDPLPPPRFDFGDERLVNALNELASLEKAETEGDDVVGVAVDEEREAAEAKPSEAPRAEPVPALPIQESVPAEPVEEYSVIVEPTADPKGDPLEELEELVALREGTPEPPQPRSRRGIPWGLLILVMLISVAAGMLIGRAIPRSGGASSEAVVADDAAEAPESPAVPGPALDKLEDVAVVYGQVLYRAPSQDVLPDAGARVIVFPEGTGGAVRLPTDGFRPGADDLARRVAEAAIEALGGGFATADSDGRFELQLPQAGKFEVLICSRYSARDGTLPLTDDVQELLTGHFDRPRAVVGQVAYSYAVVQCAPGTSVPVDTEFE